MIGDKKRRARHLTRRQVAAGKPGISKAVARWLLGAAWLACAVAQAFDYDGDGLGDLAVRFYLPTTTVVFPSSGASCPPYMHKKATPCRDGYREAGEGELAPGSCLPKDASWEELRCERRWGGSADIPIGGDFDGDHLADLVLWQPSKKSFWLLPSGGTCPLGTEQDVEGCRAHLGNPGKTLVPAGNDADEMDEFVLWRRQWSHVHVLPSGQACPWGRDPEIDGCEVDGDPWLAPLPADYDGDGVDDLAVQNRETGVWYFADGHSVAWGRGSDRPLPGDYNGDGKTDVAVVSNTGDNRLKVRLDDGSTLDLDQTAVTAMPDFLPCLRRVARYRTTIEQTWTEGGEAVRDHPVLWRAWLRAAHEPIPKTTQSSDRPSGFPVSAPDDYDGDGQTDFGAVMELFLARFRYALMVVLPTSGGCPGNLDTDPVEGTVVCARVLAYLPGDAKPIEPKGNNPILIPDAARSWCRGAGK